MTPIFQIQVLTGGGYADSIYGTPDRFGQNNERMRQCNPKNDF